MKRLLVTLSLALTILGCEAKEPAKPETMPYPTSAERTNAASEVPNPGLRKELLERARKRNGGKEPTEMDLVKELMRKAAEESGSVPRYENLRIVPRGAKPEIIIKGDKVIYNGKRLEFGKSIDEWKKYFPPQARCDSGPLATACVWDSIGIQAGTTPGSKGRGVSYLTIFVNKRPVDAYEGLVTHSADGTPIKPDVDYSPKKAFSGYLELDGFGIDAKTELWELLSTANPERRLTCGTRDCTHPSGTLGGNSGVLYLTTNRNDEHGNIYEFSIGR